MSEMGREDLLAVVRTVWEERDPVPPGLVERAQAAAGLAATDAATDAALDLDGELVALMELVERSEELVGARGSATYTLRFVHGETDLLVRIAVDDGRSRIDGWVVPPEPMTVRAGGHEATVTDTGRFELDDLPLGMLRLDLEPHDAHRAPFATPAFEI
ncbi:hypothetical protein [Nocardioides dongkuii]|uniref:hypothetical protein n=1 Tax=Nocardioides dongkuii TaxID=2760089 RepID=UPI0015FE52C2|nr:hypothetical protein [Nocardioides dongkuii]